ncbi:ABC transporter ATP-binding protein [Promicromonospora sukumoe]|uniref:NitT/TauT family transport system ATP-binding protein n=1 Tax=Promicromonospora sukumoe TaxID=88382 RepID=A0A7W3PE66_9MICO|nr:ABC transporter ATP-binding protein [Promicromonospora sukumoe]MBA8808227.1 NitT/TauT family transport system ATP-binding protein [Promicromonospora sukumoe]
MSRAAGSAGSVSPGGPVPDVVDPAAVDPAVDHTGGARLDVRGLRKVYGGIARGGVARGSSGAGSRGGAPVEAVADLTFEVRPGELVCVVGPSGAGKTTLLRCLAGLLPPTSGQVLLGDTPVTGPPAGMAVVLQEYGRSLFPWLTVARNVELPLREKGVAKRRRAELVEETLAAVGLADVADAYPWQLSGGMQQRVAIARAVAYEPQVLLMDEPFAAVDAQTRFELEDLVRALWRRLGITVVFVTHDIDEAIYLGERVLVLSARPTVLLEDVAVGLGPDRDQLGTRGAPEFARLRTHVYELVQQAKQGARTLDAARLTSATGGPDA